MKIMIVYASIEGQTRKIAQTYGQRPVEASGHQAALANVGGGMEFGAGTSRRGHLCAPIHAGRYPTPFVDLVQREQSWLTQTPRARLSR